MLRSLALVGLLLLAGCASPTEPPKAVPTDADGDWLVTATRVEPQTRPIHWTGQIGARLCALDGQEACRGPSVVQAGLAAGISWDEPTHGVRDGDALFWRVDAVVHWSTSNPLVTGLDVLVETLGCPECPPRLVATHGGASPVQIPPLDVFLTDEERGVQLHLRPATGSAMMLAWGDAAIEFQVEGNLTGFVPAGSPIILSGPQPDGDAGEPGDAIEIAASALAA